MRRLGPLPIAVVRGSWQYRTAGPNELHTLLQEEDPDDDCLLAAMKAPDAG